ncbi:UDP-galactopyranose mutase, partial [Campylobacter jejuni]|nr:UDP-galactopyranose mutase [Campylobacter jejuni]EDP1823303.1 UDP-galactopyranose mutase [Campylobacter jejuni]EGA9336544.1 UDP-galactopyranose mutase [Campylobacter jejuni]
ALEYRSLKFEHKILNLDNFQGVAVVNYTDKEIPYTRIIEHKHFEFGNTDTTVISEEYPLEWIKGIEPYYPINDEKNQALYEKYKQLAKHESNVYFGGRLGEYRYYDMQDVVRSALLFCKNELKNKQG